MTGKGPLPTWMLSAAVRAWISCPSVKASHIASSPEIQLERDRELLFQTGVRYFDYMRNHTYNLLKGGFRDLTEADVAAGALFLPVSLDAMNNNPKVKQTAYWVGKF